MSSIGTIDSGVPVLSTYREYCGSLRGVLVPPTFVTEAAAAYDDTVPARETVFWFTRYGLPKSVGDLAAPCIW